MLQVKNVRTGDTLELDIPVDSLIPQDAGAREAASVEFDLWDPTIVFEFLPEDEFTVSTVASTSVILFGGFARSLETEVDATGRRYHVIGYDYSTLLDRINVVSDDRPAGESDHTRLAYFMTTYGSGLLDDDPAGIATLNASMPAQKFRLITLRQAIEQILGTALATGTYRLNASKKLDTWDSDPGLEPAPYDIVLGTPGVGQLAPESLSIKADTSSLFNAYWVRGATAAGSGWFTDPASIAAWGRREKYIDAPDSDLSWKAFNVGHAALADTAQPKYRGSFTVYDGDWRSNQRFALTSPIHGPAGGFTAEPFDTVRITRRYLSGTAREAFDVEFGSPKGSFAAKHGKEARRADGVGPGSGGWGPGGGFGGVGTGDAGEGDCGCTPFTILSTETAADADRSWLIRRVTTGAGTADDVDGGYPLKSDLRSGVHGDAGAKTIGTPLVATESNAGLYVQHVPPAGAGAARLHARVIAITTSPNALQLANPTEPIPWILARGAWRGLTTGGVSTTGRPPDPGHDPLYLEIGETIATGQVNSPNDQFNGPATDFDVIDVVIPVDEDGILRFTFHPGRLTNVDGYQNLLAGSGHSAQPHYPSMPTDWGGGQVLYLTTDITGSINPLLLGDSYTLDWQTDESPKTGQPINRITIGTGDGLTTNFTYPYAYAPGSLKAYTDDLREFNITETDPATGQFAFDTAPGAGETITAEAQGA